MINKHSPTMTLRLDNLQLILPFFSLNIIQYHFKHKNCSLERYHQLKWSE